MSKRFVYNMLSAAVIVISLLIYLFTELDIIKLDVSAKIGILFFSVMTGLGLLNIVYGLIYKTRAYIYASGVLLLGSWLYASFEFFEVKFAVQIIVCLLILAIAYFIAVFVTKGVNSLTADNEVEGYKNYKERKEEKDLNDNNGKNEEIKIKSFKE